MDPFRMWKADIDIMSDVGEDEFVGFVNNKKIKVKGNGLKKKSESEKGSILQSQNQKKFKKTKIENFRF